MMDNRLTFLYHLVGVMWGHIEGVQPGAGHPGAKRISVEGIGKSVPERKRDGVAQAKKCMGLGVEKSH